jgi:hypothetical protein
MIVAYFTVILQKLSEGTVENYENSRQDSRSPSRGSNLIPHEQKY